MVDEITDLSSVLGDGADPAEAFAFLESYIYSRASSGDVRVSELERDLRRLGDEIMRRVLQRALDRATEKQSVVHRVCPPSNQSPSDSPDDQASEADLPTDDLGFSGKRRRVGKDLRTSFGKVRVVRFVFSMGALGTACPLDDLLGLPVRSFSYPVQDFVLRGMARGPVDEALAALKEATAASIPKRQALELAAEAVLDFEEFYRSRSLDTADTKDPYLIVGLDCKGVPIRRPKTEATPRRLQLKPGEKKQQKKMAVVASIHSTSRYDRGAEEIVRNLLDPNHCPDTSARPRPSARRVFASVLKSKEEVAQEIVEELERRDPHKKKTVVCLTDGERSLQNQVETTIKQSFGRTLLILDLIHVLGYLWGAAHAMHPHGSHEARQFVWEKLEHLLRGQLQQVLKELKSQAKAMEREHRKPGAINDAARYFENNAEYMKYDEYLADGLPIASGCAEGACSHLVKDRMERTGASWSLEGAETVLKLRALEKSGDFEEYSRFREKMDRQRLFNVRYALSA